MFDIFKKDTQGQPKDVKYVRDSLLHFIKEQLRKAEGGEGANIKGLQIFIACPLEEKHMYEAAVYFGALQMIMPLIFRNNGTWRSVLWIACLPMP
jgi:hypothetical protein